MKGINIKLDTLNLIEEKVQKGLKLIGTERDFVNRTSLAQVIRPTINKWNLMKLRSFCIA